MARMDTGWESDAVPEENRPHSCYHRRVTDGYWIDAYAYPSGLWTVEQSSTTEVPLSFYREGNAANEEAAMVEAAHQIELRITDIQARKAKKAKSVKKAK